jgi:hypothetical protein
MARVRSTLRIAADAFSHTEVPSDSLGDEEGGALSSEGGGMFTDQLEHGPREGARIR